MKRIFSALIILISSFAIVGCQNMSNQDVGTLSGAVAGGLLGSTIGGGRGQVLAIAAGTVAGAIIGGKIGQHMDQEDKAKMNQTLDNNSVGQPGYWRNANTGTTYKVTPVKNVTVGNNKYCREYKTSADIAGKQQQMYGTACRQPDGTWKAVN